MIDASKIINDDITAILNGGEENYVFAYDNVIKKLQSILNEDVYYEKIVVKNSEYISEFVKNFLFVKALLDHYDHADFYTIHDDLRKFYSQSVLPSYKLSKNSLFYKMRKKDAKNPTKLFKRKDLFHVPWDKRECINTYRYSISGYPCVYLGRSLYVCWEELRRPSIGDVYIVGMRNVEDINFLDLRLRRKEFKDREDLKGYLSILPIIIACSIRVRNDNATFKIEYVLPQYLLSTIQSVNYGKVSSVNNNLGIIYTSTQVEEDINYLEENVELLDCLAVPFIKSESKGEEPYSMKLKELFEVSEPICYDVEMLKNPRFGIPCPLTMLKRNYKKSLYKVIEKNIGRTKFEHLVE